MSDLETRLLGPDDWQLWRLIRLRALADSPEAFGATYADASAFDETDWRQGLDGAGPRVVVVAGEEPVAIGGGYLRGSGWLHVIAMWTDPAWRGKRLAARVLTALVEWAAPRDLAVELDVAIGNGAARRSYEAFGFSATGETRPIRDDSPLSVERMVLDRAAPRATGTNLRTKSP